jgi:molybdopterin molybdotransferase
MLSEDFNFKPNLTYFLPVNVKTDEKGQLIANPCIGGGSGDLSNLLESNAFLELPSRNSNFKKYDAFELFLFRNL